MGRQAAQRVASPSSLAGRRRPGRATAAGQLALDLGSGRGRAAGRPPARRRRPTLERLSADEWYLLGCQHEAADPPAAIGAYQRALSRDPHHADAQINLGRLLHEAGDLASAEACYRAALATRPGDATATFNLGVALDELGRVDAAREAYRAAIALEPACADAHYNLARLLEEQGDRPGALEHLRAYRRLSRGRRARTGAPGAEP